MTSLSGTVAVVTGAGSGIGLAITERFVEAGAHVVAGDLDPPSSTAAVTSVRCDVTIEKDLGNLLRTASGVGPVRVLVTSAGIALKQAIDVMGIAEWRRVLDVNLTGTMLAIKHAVPPMRDAGGGSIIAIASVAAFRTSSPFNAAYAASKGAVVAMTKALVHELSPHGIRINALAPGIVESPLTAGFGPEWAASRNAMAPLGRLGSPREIAEVALFLAGDASSYVTGHLLVADGGATSIVVAPPLWSPPAGSSS